MNAKHDSIRVRIATRLLVAFLMTGCSGSASKPPTGAGGMGTTPSPAAASAGAPKSPVKTSARFVERAVDAGVHFTYRNGEEANHCAILESLGGGAALFDYDGDGDVDLFFTGGGNFGPNREIRGLPGALFRNGGEWQFTLVTKSAGLNHAPHFSHAAVVGDYDNDGFPDLLVTGYGGLALYHNQGDGCFQETAEPAGLSDRLWSSAAAWGDLNGDGAPDLYVVHYVNWSFDNNPRCAGHHHQPGKDHDVCPPAAFAALPDLLYFGNGDGTFRDVSREAGLRQDGKGLGALIADLDLDGNPDLYVTNDTTPNFLYHNEGAGRFEEIGLQSGTSLGDNGLPNGSMGVALGDFNLDGLPDLWVSNFERESFALYRNQGNGLFQHISEATGVTSVGGMYIGWGTVFFDFDRDGDEDVFVANGHVMRFPENSPLRQLPLLFENQGGRRFENVASAAGPYLQTPHMGRGVAAGDLDDDGDLDLVVAHTNEPVALLDNQSPNENGWLQARLIGTVSNRSAIGARLTLETSAGPRIRQIVGGGSYLSHGDTRPFWGLPRGVSIKSLTVRWPSGTVQTLTTIEPNRLITLIEPSAPTSFVPGD